MREAHQFLLKQVCVALEYTYDPADTKYPLNELRPLCSMLTEVAEIVAPIVLSSERVLFGIGAPSFKLKSRQTFQNYSRFLL